MKIRRIISLTVFLSFLFLAASGIMLFLSPQGRVAYWAGWTMFGLSKDEYTAVHTTFMVLFLVAGIWHIVLNWRPIVGYLKDRTKRVRLFTPESSVAMVLALAFLAGPLLRFPPFHQFLDAGESVKAYWENVRGAPPWGHAEESRLDAFCRRIVDFQRWEGEGHVVVDCQEAQAALADEGIRVEGLDQRILDIAEANGTTPQAVAEIVVGVARPATPEEVALGLAGGAGVAESHGEGEEGAVFEYPPSGLGRMTLRGYGQEYGYDLEMMGSILGERGMTVEPDTPLREEADRLGLSPSEIIDALNSGG